MELGGSGKTLAKGRNRHNEQQTEKGFESQIFGWPRLVGHDGLHAFRMVRREAPSALRGRGRIRQFDPGRLMPALRVGERQEGRPLEENGPNRQGMQRLREEIRAAGWNGFRLAEDAAVRMDRVFGPPIPIPFGENGVIGQQERRFHREILAFEGLCRSRGDTGRRLAFRQRLDRRNVFPEMALGVRNPGRQAAPRAFEKPILRADRDGRRNLRSEGVRRREAERREGRRRLRRNDRQRIEDNPRRRQIPQRPDRGDGAFERSPRHRRNQGPRRFRKPDGTRERNPPIPIRVRGIAPRIFAGGIAGLAESILLLLEHARGSLPKGAGLHRTRGEKAQNSALSELGKGERFR